LSKDNPLVPGNEVALAAFAQVQQELWEAELAVESARTALKEMVARRDCIENRWDQRLSQLAAFTKFATDGNPTAMLSAGFLVRERNSPAQIPAAPTDLRALTNGKPGRTKLTWAPVDGALIYLLQVCLQPQPEDDWTDLPMSTKSSCEVDGAEPGKIAWFRVAAVNTAGQGPWSAPAQRPVM
jgi:hypothetical protein